MNTCFDPARSLVAPCKIVVVFKILNKQTKKKTNKKTKKLASDGDGDTSLEVAWRLQWQTLLVW